MILRSRTTCSILYFALGPLFVFAQAQLQIAPALEAHHGGALSGDGSTVVGYQQVDSGGAFVSYYWTPGDGLNTLPAYPGSTWNIAVSSSSDGSTIAGTSRFSHAPTTYHNSWIWTEATGYQTVETSTLSPYGGRLSSDGNTWYSGQSKWTSSVGLQPIDGLTGFLVNVSADGSVLLDRNGILKNGSTYMALGTVGATSSGTWNFSYAYNLSADGKVVVGSVLNQLDPEPGHYRSQAFRWTEAGGFELLGFYNGSNETDAYAMSGDGNIVIGDYGSIYPLFDSNPYYGFVWDPVSGMRSAEDALSSNGVDLTGWSGLSLLDISTDGTVLYGHGTYLGNKTGFYVTGFSVPTAVPEPAAWAAIFGLGALVFTLHRRVRLPDCPCDTAEKNDDA